MSPGGWRESWVGQREQLGTQSKQWPGQGTPKAQGTEEAQKGWKQMLGEEVGVWRVRAGTEISPGAPAVVRVTPDMAVDKRVDQLI